MPGSITDQEVSPAAAREQVSVVSIVHHCQCSAGLRLLARLSCRPACQPCLSCFGCQAR